MDITPDEIVAARIHKRLTQAKAAEICGVGIATWQRWERGIQKPHPINVEQIRSVFGLHPTSCGLKSMESVHDQQYSMVIVPAETHTMTELKRSFNQDLTARLMQIVMTSHRAPKAETLKELQQHIDGAVNHYNTTIHEDFNLTLNRRNALRSLILLPLGLCLTGTTTKARPAEDILTQCAAGIAACWFFDRGKELQMSFDAVNSYIPALTAIADSSSRHRHASLALLIQCYLLKATMARHLENNDRSILYLKQARIGAEEIEDPVMMTLIPRIQATTHYLSGQRRQAAEAANMAMSILEFYKKHIPLHVQGYINTGSATYQAFNGQFDQARITLNRAYETFTEAGEWNWIGHDQANLIHNEGMTQYYAGNHKKAASAMQQLLKSPDACTVFATVEHVLDHAKIEIGRTDQARDMELCINLVERGIIGAKDVGSQQRLNEAWSVYGLLCAAWPTEPRVKELQSQLID